MLIELMTPVRSAPYRAARAIYHQLKGKNRLAPAFRQDRAVFHAYKTAVSSPSPR